MDVNKITDILQSQNWTKKKCNSVRGIQGKARKIQNLKFVTIMKGRFRIKLLITKPSNSETFS